MRAKASENMFLRFHYILLLSLLVYGYFVSENKHIITVFSVIAFIYVVLFEIYSFLMLYFYMISNGGGL